MKEKNYKMVACIWSVLSIVLGGKLIKDNYAIASNNIYAREISKLGQGLAVIVAVTLALIIIWWFCGFIYRALKENGKEREICIFAFPVLIILVSFLLSDVSNAGTLTNYYVGDEKNIWDSAARLYPFMFVYSSQIFLMCFFILPTIFAPSLIKLCFVSYVAGYTIYRVKSYYKSKLYYALYVLFLSTVFLQMGIGVHRMHWYAMLYLFIAVKLFFDDKEGKRLGLKELTAMAFAMSLLTIWRREGIYLLVWGLVLLILVYAKNSVSDRFFSGWKRIVLVFVITELLVCLPETLYERTQTTALADGDVVWRAFLVHMLDRSSFDRVKCAEELAVIDKYLDIEIIDRYNAEVYNKYDDCYWEWSWYREGKYYAPTQYWSAEGAEIVKEEVIKIIQKQPLIFIESRIKAFGMAANKAGYNLFLPLILTLIAMVKGICKKERCLAALSLGILGHTFLTAFLMPASYFKYFYQMYLFGYVFGLIMLFEYLLKDGLTAKK